MELQLGLALALPNIDPLVLQLGPPPWLHSINNKKRSFESAAFVDEKNYEEELLPRTLPLLLWDDQKPNQEDDDPDDKDIHQGFFASNKNKERGEGFLGWPPIKLHRRNLINCLQSHQNHGVFADCAEGRQLLPAVPNPNSKYVKVKVEGVAIARKIDLSLHYSFPTLKQSLFHMFGLLGQENFGCYELIYQDAEGDWLLAEDKMTWRSFTGSAKRLKLKKSSG